MKINKQLKKYVNTKIKPEYINFDKGHSIKHFNYVIKNSLKYAKLLNKQNNNLNYNMVYLIAAYHDLGIKEGKKGHAKTSARYLLNDNELKKFFSEDEINIMVQAVLEHSSSAKLEPTNIYSKLF